MLDVASRVGYARSVGLALLGVLGLAIGVVSCQSTGPRIAEQDVRPPAAGDAPARAPQEPELRVRIRSGVEQAKVAGPARLMVGRAGETGRSMPGPLTLGTAIDGGVRVTDAVGGIYSFGPKVTVEIAAVEGGATSAARPGYITVDNKPFPGRLRVLSRQISADGATSTQAKANVLDVIEVVGLETYLPGVVASELLRDWTLEAFEAQAICARTYALHQRDLAMAAGREFDVESSTMDQAYGGITELPYALQGVRNTRGVVVTWRGKVLRTYYSSTCGGRFAGAKEVWPIGPGYEYNHAEPIQAHNRASACEPATYYRWEVTRERDALSRQIREWGKSNGSEVGRLGTVASVEVEKANTTGRPATYRVRDTQGKAFTLKAEELRLACNATAPGVPEITNKTRVRSGDLEFDVRGTQVVIRGRGFGHGVGMCQWCLQEFSKRGQTWREMLPVFYPGSKLERAY